jgi:hypothetical protein
VKRVNLAKVSSQDETVQGDSVSYFGGWFNGNFSCIPAPVTYTIDTASTSTQPDPNQNHHSQPNTADQARNVKRLHSSADLLPSGYHTPSSFPKNLELLPARFAFFVVNLYGACSNRSAYPRHDGVEGPLRFDVGATALWTFDR